MGMWRDPLKEMESKLSEALKFTRSGLPVIDPDRTLNFTLEYSKDLFELGVFAHPPKRFISELLTWNHL